MSTAISQYERLIGLQINTPFSVTFYLSRDESRTPEHLSELGYFDNQVLFAFLDILESPQVAEMFAFFCELHPEQENLITTIASALPNILSSMGYEAVLHTSQSSSAPNEVKLTVFQS